MKTWMCLVLSLILLMMFAVPVAAIESPGSDPPARSPTLTDTNTASAVVSSWAITHTDIDIGQRIVDLSAMRTTTSTSVVSPTSTESRSTDTAIQMLFVALVGSILMNFYLWRRVSERTAREPPTPDNPAYDDFPPEGWM
jgi:hypothetical protein